VTYELGKEALDVCYVGIDVHRKRSQVAVINEGGEVLASRNVPNGTQPVLGVIGGLPSGTPGPPGSSPLPRTGRRWPASSSFVLAAARLRALQQDTARATAQTGSDEEKPQHQAPHPRRPPT